VPRAKIPSRFELPFGYVVKVNQTSQRHMRRVAEAKPGEETPWALWDDSASDTGGTIWLLRARSRAEKLDDFGHEMIHAVNDWCAWMLARER
jgi:hypothetical protein